jgi:hypothetical protein
MTVIMEWMKSVLQLIIAVLAVLGSIMAFVRFVGVGLFDKAVMESLKREAPVYREFHEAQFKEEIEVTKATVERSRRTHDMLIEHSKEFRDFVTRFEQRLEPKIDDMLMVGKLVISLEAAIRDLRATLIEHRHEFTQHQTDDAGRFGRLEAGVTALLEQKKRRT